jgi:aldose 1-epimerase
MNIKFILKINLFLMGVIMISCTPGTNKHTVVSERIYGTLADGRQVTLYKLENKKGATAELINFGAIVVSLTIPDRNGKMEDIVLGFDNLDDYVQKTYYFGAIVGRYGNRIGKGIFSIDGDEYQVSRNNGENHLHGGFKGFDKVLWNAEINPDDNSPSVKMSYESPDGEEGYPGTVNIEVIYTLTDENELKIEYSGKTDKPTILNPTHHSYFNLSGKLDRPILDHELMIAADFYTPVDAGLITTGEILPVEGTPFDFRQSKKIGKDIESDHVQLKYAGGFDHNWVSNDYTGKVRNVATLYEPQSGRSMEVLTDQPGLQFYSGNFLDGTVRGKNDIVYPHRSGLCLEAQDFPDSPNKAQFPSPVIRPGETYRQVTIYRFSVK